jgi:hypothetical protein
LTRQTPWLILGGLVVIALGLVALGGPQSGQDSPDHSSASDGKNGTSALRLYAAALGHPSEPLEASFNLPASQGLAFVFTPAPFSQDEAAQLKSWIRSGAIAVFASEQPDAQLAIEFGINRPTATVPASPARSTSVLAGVGSVVGADRARPLEPSASQVPLLRDHSGSVLATMTRIGSGWLVVLADPLELCNLYIGKADNGRLAADLIGLAQPGSPVLFDEFHHGVAPSSSPVTGWILTGWGAPLAWAILVVFVGLALRGRSFGPNLPLSSGTDRSSAEYARAVGDLLQRTNARALTLQTLDLAARRTLAERLGLRTDPSGRDFSTVLQQRFPQAFIELRAIEERAAAGSLDEPGLLKDARALHELAYPIKKSA